MPSLSIIKPMGHAKFLSHGLKLPSSAHWKQPMGIAAVQYNTAILPNQKVATPNLVPPFFLPQNPNKLNSVSLRSMK